MVTVVSVGLAGDAVTRASERSDEDGAGGRSSGGSSGSVGRSVGTAARGGRWETRVVMRMALVHEGGDRARKARGTWEKVKGRKRGWMPLVGGGGGGGEGSVVTKRQRDGVQREGVTQDESRDARQEVEGTSDSDGGNHALVFVVAEADGSRRVEEGMEGVCDTLPKGSGDPRDRAGRCTDAGAAERREPPQGGVGVVAVHAVGVVGEETPAGGAPGGGRVGRRARGGRPVVDGARASIAGGLRRGRSGRPGAGGGGASRGSADHPRGGGAADGDEDDGGVNVEAEMLTHPLGGGGRREMESAVATRGGGGGVASVVTRDNVSGALG
jgi:hypothetical protein